MMPDSYFCLEMKKATCILKSVYFQFTSCATPAALLDCLEMAVSHFEWV